VTFQWKGLKTTKADIQEWVSLVERMSEAITEEKVGNRGGVVHAL
jgi:hypothetical protein